MPTCGYEFYLLVFNSTSHSFVRVEYSNEIKFVSTRGHVISSIFVLCKGIWILLVESGILGSGIQNTA